MINNMNNMNNQISNSIQINRLNQLNNMGNINSINQMNNFNSLNQINNTHNLNMNLQNFINCPIKGIYNKTKITEFHESTFINSVLQSFSCLNCIKDWYNILNTNKNNFNNSSSITKEVYNLLLSLYKGEESDSSNIILHFNNKFKSVYNKQIQQDPYHFFFYFLDLLHLENNFPINPNYDINVYINQNIFNKRNNNYMYNLFNSFFQQTQNSIISQCFSNIMKNEIKCQNCPSVYYYTFKNILKFDIHEFRKFRDQAYPQKTCMNLNMDECFKCFIGGYDKKCQTCGNLKATIFSNICTSAKVLIITFKRNVHSYHCDIDFNRKLDITKYCAQEKNNGINSNTSYELKACISLNNNQQYFADININNVWYRFFNDEVNLLGNVKNDIHFFEPQLLIYELEGLQNNQMYQILINQLQMKRNQLIGTINMMKQNLAFKNALKNQNFNINNFH